MTNATGRWLLCVKCRGVTDCHTDAEKQHFWIHLLIRLFSEEYKA